MSHFDDVARRAVSSNRRIPAPLCPLDWHAVANLLGATPALRSAPTFPCVALTWANGRQALVFENGGEWNLVVREPGAPAVAGTIYEAPWSWRPRDSVPYINYGSRIEAGAVAYRLRCQIEGRCFDYAAVPPRSAEELERAVSAAPFDEEESERLVCACQRRGGGVVGIVCLHCQFARAPLPAVPL